MADASVVTADAEAALPNAMDIDTDMHAWVQRHRSAGGACHHEATRGQFEFGGVQQA
ncbi:hypothetical protein D3C80_1913020 [compost metagenome]